MVKPRVVHPDKHPINSQEKPQQQEKARRHDPLKTKKKDVNIFIKSKYSVTLLEEKSVLSPGGGRKWHHIEISDLEVLSLAPRPEPCF